MKARDVMTTPVITLRPDTPVNAAAALLVSHGFTAAPVMDAAGRVIGIVTETDLVRGRVVPEGWAVAELPMPPVVSVMTPSPMCMRPEDDLADLVALMLDTRTRSIPIVDNGELVGIVTRRDVMRVVARRERTRQDVLRRRGGLVNGDRGSARLRMSTVSPRSRTGDRWP